MNWPPERKPVIVQVPGIWVKAEQSNLGPPVGMVELPKNMPFASRVLGVICEKTQVPTSFSVPAKRFSVAPVVRRNEPEAEVDPAPLTIPPSWTPAHTIFALSYCVTIKTEGAVTLSEEANTMGAPNGLRKADSSAIGRVTCWVALPTEMVKVPEPR